MPHDVIQMPPERDEAERFSPEQLARAAREAIFKAMEILRDKHGMPIEELIAMQAARRPDLLLRAVSRFAATPKTALPDNVQALHLAALRALAVQGAKVIDYDPFFD